MSNGNCIPAFPFANDETEKYSRKSVIDPVHRVGSAVHIQTQIIINALQLQQQQQLIYFIPINSAFHLHLALFAMFVTNKQIKKKKKGEDGERSFSMSHVVNNLV